MDFQMIVATDMNYGIAKNGNIAWKLPKELQFFKNKTSGHIVVMGKNTFFSLPNNKPLKNRYNIVLTRKPNKYAEQMKQYNNLLFIDNLDDLPIFPEKTVFIIGGKQVYELFYHKCNTIWFSKIKSNYNCDLSLNMIELLQGFTLEEITENNTDFIIYKYVVNI